MPSSQQIRESSAASMDVVVVDKESPREWKDKKIALADIPSKISNGSKVYIGSCGATAEASLAEMVDDFKLADIQIIQMIPGGDLPHMNEAADRFRTSSFYSFFTTNFFHPEDQGNREGLSDYIPVGVNEVHRLLKEKSMQVDVSIIKVTPPHKGFVSLGFGVESTPDFIKHSKIVIAEINEHMPWTEGPSKIPINDIDWWIPVNTPLKNTEQLWPGLAKGPFYSQEILDQIALNVVKEIPDRATLRFGVAPIIYSVFKHLRRRKDLGLHSDLLTETLYKLHEEGVITNKYKTLDTGRSIVSMAHGSTELYDFCDRNPVIEFHPSRYTCDPLVLGKIENLISVVGALKVDVTGQVATDSIAHKFYGGIWSDGDSIRGAKFSKGGKPIVMLSSKSIAGRSNIVFQLPPGTGVSITRSDVEYVITEFGTAYLYGKSIRERCLAMINIAHPDFRQHLLQRAKENRYISQSQPGRFLAGIYPVELEVQHETKTGKPVLVRPIKTVDEDNLRNFFHKLSDHSVYLRYFRMLKSMPQRILQKTTDVDYLKDMALVVVSPPDGHRHEIVAIGQWVSDPRGGFPEIAFQVRDDWQGEGLGSYLFERLIKIAKANGIQHLKADVLTDNEGMNIILKRASVKYRRRTDFGVATYIFDLLAPSVAEEGESLEAPAPQS